MKKAIRVYIKGLVQGVFFRIFIRDQAQRLNLNGYVRNLEDGRVEAYFEGQANDIQKMIEICKKGPRHAKVDKVEVKEEKIQDMRNFKILHI